MLRFCQPFPYLGCQSTLGCNVLTVIKNNSNTGLYQISQAINSILFSLPSYLYFCFNDFYFTNFVDVEMHISCLNFSKLPVEIVLFILVFPAFTLWYPYVVAIPFYKLNSQRIDVVELSLGRLSDSIILVHFYEVVAPLRFPLTQFLSMIQKQVRCISFFNGFPSYFVTGNSLFFLIQKSYLHMQTQYSAKF